MSNVKNNIKSISNINLTNLNEFRDNVDENFGKALELLITNWVSNGKFTISIATIPNDNSKVKFSTFLSGTTTDVKYDFLKHINENINTNDQIKKLGQFSVDTSNNELGFKSSTTPAVDWKNYPCVTSSTDKKEVKLADGSVTYEISGFTYYANGTKKDKTGNVSNYVCSEDKKTIMSTSTTTLTVGGGSPSSGGSTGLATGRSAIAAELEKQGAGGSLATTVKNLKTTTTESTSNKTLLEEVKRMKKLMSL